MEEEQGREEKKQGKNMEGGEREREERERAGRGRAREGGAPFWFIMFSLVDVKHPVCFYYANIQETFSSDMCTDNECYRLIAHNPVAGA